MHISLKMTNTETLQTLSQIREAKYDDVHVQLAGDRNLPALTDRWIWSESAEALVLLLHCDICSLALWCLPWYSQ